MTLFNSLDSACHHYSQDIGNSLEYLYYSSSMITPSKCGATGIHIQTVKNVTRELRDDIGDRVCGNVSVIEFVKHVWGIRTVEINALVGHKFSLAPGPLTCYREILADTKHREKLLYEPFKQISNKLIDDARTLLKKEAKAKTTLLLHLSGDKNIRGNFTRTLRRPDLFAVPIPHGVDSDISWRNIVVPFEVKRSPAGPITPTRPRKRSWLEIASRKRGRPSGIQSTMVMPLSPSGKVPNVDSPWSIPLREEQPRRSSRISGKQLKEASSPWSLPLRQGSSKKNLRRPSRQSKEAHSRNFQTLDEPLFDLPICSLSAKTSQYPQSAPEGHGTTVAAAATRITKRKAPDIAEFTSSPPKRPHTKLYIPDNELQLARYALDCMDSASRHYTSGFYLDGLYVSLWYYDRTYVVRTAKFNFIESPDFLALVLYAISSCDSRHGGFDPFILPMSSSPPPFVGCLPEYLPSIDQRFGEQIVIRPSDGPMKRFKLTGGLLYAYRGLLGRGTMVFPVTPLEKDDSPRHQVVKISWPNVQRKREAELIKCLRETISEMVAHLPNVTCCVALSAEELQLPRVKMGISVPEDCERELHMMAMESCRALWEVGGIKEFQDAFVDCVECHYAAYQFGRVLHRDLSVNNLMVSAHEEQKRPLGILLDWDLASRIGNQNEAIVSNARQRTGTLPFMSLDLLRAKAPPHRYCHDLESFFYIMIWASVHFNLSHKSLLPFNPVFEDWINPSMAKAANPKKSFLAYIDNAKEIYAEIRPEFKQLEMEWIVPLRALFRSVYVSDSEDSGHVSDCLEEKITFETFMTTIGRVPRRLKCLKGGKGKKAVKVTT
ncbi:hypothetical protein AX15_002097 [Amanita polypyramis BW_CC]|nr:hypothetical protein AX15_002097 [Amanita polypyramis BW_CC]